MLRRWIAGLRLERKRLLPLGLGFALYVLWVYVLSPARYDPDTPAMVMGLTTFDLEHHDAWLIWIHNLYGLYSIPWAVLMLLDEREQSFPVWPLVVASILVIGIWPLFAYYAVRQPHDHFTPPRTRWVRFLESPIPALYTAVFSIGLTWLAFTRGNPAVLWQAVQGDLYIHGCTLDLVLIWAFFPLALRVDMRKRGAESPALLWGLSALWLIGPVLWLLIRPRLPDAASASSSASS
jgi:hypothetical protein